MQKYLTGTVKTNAAKDTAVVEVTLWKIHRIFKKRYRRTARYLVHNPGNIIPVGAKVEIIPTRPLSKRKSWRIQPLTTSAAPNRRTAEKRTAVKTKIKEA